MILLIIQFVRMPKKSELVAELQCCLMMVELLTDDDATPDVFLPLFAYMKQMGEDLDKLRRIDRGESFLKTQRHFNYRVLFRMTKADLFRTAAIVGPGGTMRARNGLKFQTVEGLAIVLYRLATGSKLADVILIFANRCEEDICDIYGAMLLHLWEKYQHLLTLETSPLATQHNLYVEKVQEYTRSNLDIIGFIDGTFRGTACPVVGQRAMYNGYKRKHGVIFEAITSPDGLIVHVHGPITGANNDRFVIARSRVGERLGIMLPGRAVYGDAAYSLGPGMLVGYSRQECIEDPAKRALTRKLNDARATVEYGFKDVISRFPFFDLESRQRTGQMKVGTSYKVACLLSNEVSCLYGCQTSVMFNCNTPTLESYLVEIEDMEGHLE